MKKIFCIVLGLISIFALAACGGTTPQITVDSPPPWSSSANPADAYERTEYKVEKKNEITGETVANGTMVYELVLDHVGGENNNFAYSSITMNFELTYTDAATAADRGKTDRVYSKVIFQADALVPQYSEKAVTLEKRENSADKSYTLKNDYLSGKSELTTGEETKTLDFAGNSMVGVYDNEMLYYAVRSFSTTAAGSAAQTIKVTGFYDMHASGKYEAQSIRITCAAESALETLYFPQFGGKFIGDEQGSVSALKVNVSLNSSLSGPPIELKYSQTPFTVGENATTKKVLLSIKTFEYDISQAELQYTTVYTLSDYSVTKGE